MSKGFPQSVRDLVAVRSELLCEGCGGPGPLELHHRQYRSRGGEDVVSNSLALCGWGNHTGCHGVAHSMAGELKGWSIRSGFVPAEVPVLHATHGLVLLSEDGKWTPVKGEGWAY